MTITKAIRGNTPRLTKTGTLWVALFALGACTLTGGTPPAANNFDFREGRYQQVAKIQAYRACRDEALGLDSQARERGSVGAYLNSARVIEKCEAGLGGNADGIQAEQRMRLQALGVQNYFKGGDVKGARGNFDTFKRSFPDRDLYFPDGSSFMATMETLLGQADPTSYGAFAVLNVNRQIKSEIRRLNHWHSK